MKRLKMIDLFTGIGGFTLAGERTGMIDTIMCAETDSYNKKLIDQNLSLDNAGDISHFGTSELLHPQNPINNPKYDETPAVELTGFCTVTAQDFYEGILPYPDIITGGFPCQEVTSANVHCQDGIDGVQSGLVQDQLNIIEDLEPSYVIFENAERLNSKGLDRILTRLNTLGYIVEYETVSAIAFNYPHYRHRMYIVGYLPSSAVATNQARVFDSLRTIAQYNLDKPYKLPLAEEAPEWLRENSVAKDPKSIKLRTKRINSLGNAIIPDIAKAIFDSIIYEEKNVSADNENESSTSNTEPTLSLQGEQWVDKHGIVTHKLPSRGFMNEGILYSTEVCRLLNVSKQRYEGLYPTLLRKDGNNNFSCKSRLSRPGGLGGLTGKIMSIGVSEGGLHPNFCERFMGYDKDYTLLKQVPEVAEIVRVKEQEKQLSMIL